ncbi:MAG: SDR family oxidoreductase [Nocardiaceae bacterium]|nr:SDR family oxidoreductase [Nocardiaceae bacterium]
MKDFRGKVAVITGAGSGIGRALAIALTKAGAKVAISDWDAAGLQETAALCRAEGGEPHSQVLDVRQKEAVHAYADLVAAHFGTVNLVINNAGITIFGSVEESPYKDIEKVMDVDFWGVVYGTKAFLPYLIASGDGHVVNVSSVFGLFGFPRQSSYNAAKFAVRGFTESLRQEMLIERHPVKVTCVHPGGIKTNIVKNASSSIDEDLSTMQRVFEEVLTRTSPEDAAKTILNSVKNGDAKCLIGLDAKVMDLTVRALGSNYQRLFATVTSVVEGRLGLRGKAAK